MKRRAWLSAALAPLAAAGCERVGQGEPAPPRLAVKDCDHAKREGAGHTMDGFGQYTRRAAALTACSSCGVVFRETT